MSSVFHQGFLLKKYYFFIRYKILHHNSTTHIRLLILLSSHRYPVIPSALTGLYRKCADIILVNTLINTVKAWLINLWMVAQKVWGTMIIQLHKLISFLFKVFYKRNLPALQDVATPTRLWNVGGNLAVSSKENKKLFVIMNASVNNNKI